MTAESLKQVQIDLAEYVDNKTFELDAGAAGGYVYFDAEQFKYELELQAQDVYALSDKWYARFRGGSVWFGILCFEPWWNLIENHQECWDEEQIWKNLLTHHMSIDGLQVRFKFNPESPINGFMRRHSKHCNVTTDVDTLFHFVSKAVIDLDARENLWQFEPYKFCADCNLSTYDEATECDECGCEEFTYAY